MAEPEQPVGQVDQEMQEPEAGHEDDGVEDDFFEADASAELTEDEDQGPVEYETEDEEVSLEMCIANYIRGHHNIFSQFIF